MGCHYGFVTGEDSGGSLTYSPASSLRTDGMLYARKADNSPFTASTTVNSAAWRSEMPAFLGAAAFPDQEGGRSPYPERRPNSSTSASGGLTWSMPPPG